MSSSFASQSRPAVATRGAGLAHVAEAILREVDEAFAALARRQFDAPWQRVSHYDRDTCRGR